MKSAEQQIEQLHELILRIETFGFHHAWHDEVTRALRAAKVTIQEMVQDQSEVLAVKRAS